MEDKLLSVWHLTIDSKWGLKDTVSVEATCGHLLVAQQGSDEPQNGAAADTSINVVGVRDNAEFVFQQHGGSGAVVYLHLGSTRGGEGVPSTEGPAPGLVHMLGRIEKF